jgi:rubrerythrin
MREDRFTNTEHDAALYEERRGQADDLDDRPTRAEAERDACEHLNQSEDIRPVWVCDDCGAMCDDTVCDDCGAMG